MDPILQWSILNAWGIAILAISLVIPSLIVIFVVRLVGRSTVKTVRKIRKK